MISCILLAAGESKRFGSPKPLAKMGPKTIIETMTAGLLKTQLLETIVVLGAYAQDISPFIAGDPQIKIALNLNYQNGQTSSVKAGLSCVSPQAKGIMLLPIDIPLVKNITIDRLIETFFNRNPLILIPTFDGRKGHPPIFSAKLLKKLRSLKDDEPLTTVGNKHVDETLLFPVDDEGVVLSFNTLEEFDQLIKNHMPTGL
jgi:molybdenum cofactor cytidylyltransferase